MRKKSLAVLAAACAMLLAACAGRAISEPAPGVGPEIAEAVPQTDYQEPEYEIVPFTVGNQAWAEDGTFLAFYNYQTLRLALRNEDEVSPRDAEAAARNIAVFNEKMESVTADLTEQGEEMAGNAGEAYEDSGWLTREYEDDTETSAVFTGDILSVCLRRYSYTGGVHPNSYVTGWLFDLASGQFIVDPSQIADEPQAFHDGAAELLVAKAEEAHPEDYWGDYQDIIRAGQDGVMLFDENGLVVIYSPYELGPYAIGEVELHLEWEELEPLLGQSGLARLGRGE